jgi:hypothetical protein
LYYQQPSQEDLAEQRILASGLFKNVQVQGAQKLNREAYMKIR